MSTEPSAETNRSLTIAICVTAGALIILVLKALFLPKDSLNDSVSMGLVILAGLPWLSQLLTSIKGPGGLEIVFREQQRQLTRLADEQQKQRIATDKRIGLILNALNNLLSDEAVDFLRRLHRKESIIFLDVVNNKQRYRDILRQLRLLGLISPTNSISHIIDESTVGENITPKIPLTKSGEIFADSLTEILQDAQA